MFGYFPTYQLGNVLSVQIWERLVADIPDAYEQVERGSFDAIYELAPEQLYRHGRKFTPAETIERVADGPIDPEPYLALPRGQERLARRGERLERGHGSRGPGGRRDGDAWLRSPARRARAPRRTSVELPGRAVLEQVDRLLRGPTRRGRPSAR